MQNFLEIFWTTQLGNKISEFGRMAIEFAQHSRYRPNEHPCIPAKISFAQKRFGEIGIGFLAKALNSVNGIFVAAIPQMNGLALLDITKTGTWPGWFDADGDKLACLFRRFGSQGEGFLKCGMIGDDMIGRKHGHYCGVGPARDPASPKGNRRHRVALRWRA